MMRLVVTDHALERAQQRFGHANVDRKLIFDDVIDALLARRGGKRAPNGQLCVDADTIFVWTVGEERVYVVTVRRTRRRVFLQVITSLPGNWRGERAYRRAA